METNRLRQFCVVYETRNLRKAAEIVGLSHSALSKSLKVLQEEIKKKLLVHKGRNIEVTDEGHQFFERARRFLDAEEALFSSDPKDRSKIRIGTFEVFSTHLLGQTWGKYFPSTGLELHEILPGEMEMGLVNGSFDIGITFEPIPTAGIEFLLVGKIQMKVFVRRGAFSRVPVEELPFVAPIAPIRGTPTGAKGLDGWPAHQHSRKVLFNVGMMETGLALVRGGQAAIFLAPFVATHHNRMVAKDYELVEHAAPKTMEPIMRNIYLALRASTEETAAVKKLSSLIRKECLG